MTRLMRVACVLTLTAIYGGCFVVIKSSLPYAPPLLFAGLRAFLGGAVLLLCAALCGLPLFPVRGAWGAVLALSLTSTAMALGAMFLSPGRAGAGIASVVGNLQSVIVVGLAAVFLGEALTRDKLMAMALGLLGVMLISAPTLSVATGWGALAGVELALAGSFGVAAGGVIAKGARMGRDLVALAAWQLILGALPLFAGWAATERSVPIIWTAKSVGLLAFLVLGSGAFATVAWYWLLQDHEVGRLSLPFFLVPVFGLLLASLVFRESVRPIQTAGILLILAGTVAAGYGSLSVRLRLGWAVPAPGLVRASG